MEIPGGHRHFGVGGPRAPIDPEFAFPVYYGLWQRTPWWLRTPFRFLPYRKRFRRWVECGLFKNDGLWEYADPADFILM
jgi:hypothetical protein